MEKLGSFALNNPFSYILNLYSAGLMAGGTRFDIQPGHFESLLTFPGAQLDRQELTQLFDYLLFSPATETQWALHELAIGLKASTRAGVEMARLEQAAHTVIVRSGKCELESSPSELPPETLRIRLIHNRPWLEGLWRLMQRSILPESRELLQSLNYSPIPGRLAESKTLLEVEATTFQEIPVQDPLISRQLSRGWVTIGANGELGKRKESNLTLVIRGRPFTQNLRLGRGNVQAVVRADDLRLDLSQSGPVQDSRYLAMVQPLAKEIEEMRYQWLIDQPSPDPANKTYRAIARQVVRSLRTRGKLHEAFEICLHGDTSPSQLWNLHFALGRSDEAARALQDEIAQGDLPQHSLDRRRLELATIEGGRGNEIALELWEKSFISIFERNSRDRPHVVAECEESKLAWLPNLGATPVTLKKLWEQARDGKQHLGENHPRLAPTYEIGAWLALRYPISGSDPGAEEVTWGAREALAMAQRAYDIRREHRGEGDTAIGRSLTLLALASHTLGESETNHALQRHWLMTNVYGPKHPEVAASHHLMAAVGQDPQDNLEQGARIMSELNLSFPPPGPERVVCYRGWFHSRSAWRCTLPLVWAIA